MTSRRPSGMPEPGWVPSARTHWPALAHDVAFFDQVAQDLLDEERVAFGLAVEGLGCRERRLLAADVRHHPLDLVDRETAQADGCEG